MAPGKSPASLDAPAFLRAGAYAGFTYIGLLVMLAITTSVAATASQMWKSLEIREKERELLFAGNQFRQAIKDYYETSQDQAERFPLRLEDLTRDPRYPSTRRYLRKIHVDPITGTTDWGLVRAAGGQILGVYSRSKDAPRKRTRFRMEDRQFEGKASYSEWVFMVQLGSVPASATKGQGANK
jgi:type II secretory pathway pseudopilin PulG